MKGWSSSDCSRWMLLFHQLFSVAFSISWWGRREAVSMHVDEWGWPLLLTSMAQEKKSDSRGIMYPAVVPQPLWIASISYWKLQKPLLLHHLTPMIQYITSDGSAAWKKTGRQRNRKKEQKGISHLTLHFFFSFPPIATRVFLKICFIN